MGRITSGVGLISGINSSQIIDELVSLESQPVTDLQTRITKGTAQEGAYNALLTQLNTLKSTGDTLVNPLTFQAATAASSDENTLTATAASGAAVGTYQFQVARLVSSQQAITAGFADPNQTKVGAGTITISQGGGELNTATNLSALNGGNGVSRGVFRVTDRSGKTAAIDVSGALTLDDVAKQINHSLDVNVKATVTKNGLVLTDQTGSTAGNLTVSDVGDGTTAADLGILGNSNGADTLTGTAINTVGRNTALAQVNDGRGVRTSDAGGADFEITAGDGSTYDVSVGSAKTVGQVIDAINKTTNGAVTADVSPDGSGIRLTDAGGGTLGVAALNNSKAADDLGLTGSGNGTLVGRSLGGAIDGTLLSSLKGGSGIALGQVGVADRSGNTATVDLTGATTVQDVIADFNNAGVGIKASLNAAGDGIQVTDTSGGSGPLKIFDVDSTTAADLGLQGTYDTSTAVVNGGNLHKQYVTANTQLAALNGGKGIDTTGAFTISSSTGQSTEINLSSGNFVSLGDVIKSINARGIGVTASINAHGNGLLLTDDAGGTVTVTSEKGTTAADFNLVANGQTTNAAAGGTIDGAYEKSITVDANDTLQSVQQKVNNAGFGVTATIVNDGSGATPYRLSLTANNTGLDGRFVFDAGTTGLATRNLVQAQDAAVFLGGQDASQPLLVTSSSNQLTNVIKGVTIDLHNVSSSPVNLTVSRDDGAISAQLKSFVDTFNAINTQIGTLTTFDTTTNRGGILLGDETVNQIQDQLFSIYNSVVKGAGKYRILADLGVSIGDKAQLSFDAAKFDAAYASDPDAVKNVFTQATTGLGNVISKTIDRLTDPANGLIPVTTRGIDQQNTDFQNRITELNALLQQKKDRLTQQFANMESTLATLQSQSSALTSLGTLASLSSAKPSASSSGSSSSTSSSSSGSSSASGG